MVRITLNSGVDNLQNIAITDLLPAGLEVENPRITGFGHEASRVYLYRLTAGLRTLQRSMVYVKEVL